MPVARRQPPPRAWEPRRRSSPIDLRPSGRCHAIRLSAASAKAIWSARSTPLTDSWAGPPTSVASSFACSTAAKVPRCAGRARRRTAGFTQRPCSRPISDLPGLTVIEAEADDLIIGHECVAGLRLADGRELRAGAVVLTTGTFLRGLIHIGEHQIPAGRVGEAPSTRFVADTGTPGLCARTAQDRDAAAARRPHHRLDGSGDAARRRAARAVLDA